MVEMKIDKMPVVWSASGYLRHTPQHGFGPVDPRTLAIGTLPPAFTMLTGKTFRLSPARVPKNLFTR